MSKNPNKAWKIIIAILIPLIVGGISSLITMNQMEMFDYINKPPLAPPKWIFPIVWSILYICMGIASYFIYESNSEEKKYALKLYVIQLFFNFLWSIIFFNFKAYWISFAWLLIMCIIILVLAIKSKKIKC